jgi:hypothetical protein
MERVRMFTDLKSEISNLKSLAETIARQLYGGSRHLQNPSFRGQRCLTSKTRQADQSRRDRDEFMKELDAMRRKTWGRHGADKPGGVDAQIFDFQLWTLASKLPPC